MNVPLMVVGDHVIKNVKMHQLEDIHVAVTCQGTYFTLEMDSTISPWPKEKLE